MFNTSLWVLHHFVIHYAGQTNQGDKNNGDGADQASDSKQDTGLLQGTTPTTLPPTLQESNTPSQSDASSSVDLQPGEECKGGYRIRKISKSCPQQPSSPGSQPFTSYVPPKSYEMPLPAYFRMEKSEIRSYRRNQKTDQYNAFIGEETRYFESTYSLKKILGQGSSGVVYLATRKSDGMEVIYKSIPYKYVAEYTLESTPSPICHLRSPLVPFEETSVAQCMSSRPPNLLLSYELLLQMYLSRPGHENPYVPATLDYIALKKKYILVMEYFGGSWADLLSYVDGKGRPDIVDARDIVKEIVEAMIHLRQYGVMHNDIHAGNVMYNPETGKIKLIDFGQFAILPGWEAGKSVPLKSPDPSSTSPDYKAGDDELWTDHCILCDQQLLSTSIARLVVGCEQVAGYRIQSGLVPAIQKSRLRLLGRALDPGVENVYTWLRGGVLNGEADLDQLLVG
ncbi:hypothetical protein BASA50_007626 [Batrachochytrium salamandrivorans]|uniref:non-specific serine/threonine protein kinase n=1 Tax=Batrachochytrium salamandrivorans TaxID=1357716 RepID=A0ABQ8F6J8_9FUNG|nr:hypothetical protein BASA50_007626 [Batrachochytrium salamandrivorans]